MNEETSKALDDAYYRLLHKKNPVSKTIDSFLKYDVMRELNLIAVHGDWDAFKTHLEWLNAEYKGLEGEQDE